MEDTKWLDDRCPCCRSGPLDSWRITPLRLSIAVQPCPDGALGEEVCR